MPQMAERHASQTRIFINEAFCVCVCVCDSAAHLMPHCSQSFQCREHTHPLMRSGDLSHPSIYLSIYPSIYLSIYLSISLSLSLSLSHQLSCFFISALSPSFILSLSSLFYYPVSFTLTSITPFYFLLWGNLLIFTIYVCLSVYLLISLSVSLSIIYLSVCLFLYICPSIRRSIQPPIYLQPKFRKCWDVF